MACMLTRKVSSHSSSLNLLQRLEARLVRGIVDEEVDAAEGSATAVSTIFAAVGGVLDVARHQHRLSSRILDQAPGLMRRPRAR